MSHILPFSPPKADTVSWCTVSLLKCLRHALVKISGIHLYSSLFSHVFTSVFIAVGFRGWSKTFISIPALASARCTSFKTGVADLCDSLQSDSKCCKMWNLVDIVMGTLGNSTLKKQEGGFIHVKSEQPKRIISQIISQYVFATLPEFIGIYFGELMCKHSTLTHFPSSQDKT